jgi:hypothetical protein
MLAKKSVHFPLTRQRTLDSIPFATDQCYFPHTLETTRKILEQTVDRNYLFHFLSLSFFRFLYPTFWYRHCKKKKSLFILQRYILPELPCNVPGNLGKFHTLHDHRQDRHHNNRKRKEFLPFFSLFLSFQSSYIYYRQIKKKKLEKKKKFFGTGFAQALPTIGGFFCFYMVLRISIKKRRVVQTQYQPPYIIGQFNSHL